MGRQCQSMCTVQSDTRLRSALAVSTSASQTTLYQSEAKLGQGRFLLTASHPFANIRTHTCDLHAHGCTYKYIKMYQYTYTKAYLCLLLLFAFSQHLQFRLPSIITYKSIWPISLHAHVHMWVWQLKNRKPSRKKQTNLKFKLVLIFLEGFLFLSCHAYMCTCVHV